MDPYTSIPPHAKLAIHKAYEYGGLDSAYTSSILVGTIQLKICCKIRESTLQVNHPSSSNNWTLKDTFGDADSSNTSTDGL